MQNKNGALLFLNGFLLGDVVGEAGAVGGAVPLDTVLCRATEVDVPEKRDQRAQLAILIPIFS